MKKTLILPLMLVTALLLGACAPAGTPSGVLPQAQAAGVDSVLPAPLATLAPAPQPQATPPAVVLPPVELAPMPQVDLTGFGYAMAYAALYDMAANPDPHVGKTMKVSGTYYATVMPETQEVVHLVLVVDNTGCCEAALEFVVTGGPHTPEDFPANNSEIELTGLFGIIESGGNRYPLLTVNEIKVLKDAKAS